MKLLSLQDALELFLEQPTHAHFLAARELVVNDADYRPRSSMLVELTRLWQDQSHEELLSAAAELMPAWSLCPRVHFLAGCAADAIGDAEEADLCRFLTQTCVEGLLNSGDGRRRRPWLATYPSDIQDCLASRGLSAVAQRLVEGDDALLDIVTADDGASYWFDVTEMVAAGGEIASQTTLAGRK